jgi:uncharacterized protein (TIGR02466 family)
MSKTYTKNTIFSTPLFEFYNPDLAKKLKKFITSNPPNKVESNVAMHIKHNLSESKFDFFNSDNQTVIETRKYIASCLKEILNNLLNVENDYKIAFSESWYHIGNKNSSHDVHAHINCSWCGIYYIQSGDSNMGGETFFCNPVFSNFLDEGTIHHNDTEYIVTPEDGKLILFPSYLKHFQSLYSGTSDRIVVAFNSTILEKY